MKQLTLAEIPLKGDDDETRAAEAIRHLDLGDNLIDSDVADVDVDADARSELELISPTFIIQFSNYSALWEKRNRFRFGKNYAKMSLIPLQAGYSIASSRPVFSYWSSILR